MAHGLPMRMHDFGHYYYKMSDQIGTRMQSICMREALVDPV